MYQAEVLVFDTGPLSHFALADWFGVLKAVVGDRIAVVPDVVATELRAGGAIDSRIPAVVEASWIEVRVLQTDDELAQFAHFASLLVKDDRNVGEAGVLALAKTLSGTAVVDDRAARKAAKDHGITLRPTLALLCEAVRFELLTVKLVSALADDLLATEYRLPFQPGGFEKWANENGLFDLGGDWAGSILRCATAPLAEVVAEVRDELAARPKRHRGVEVRVALEPGSRIPTRSQPTPAACGGDRDRRAEPAAPPALHARDQRPA
jgi:predicted nucleic acid-binding protein